MDSGVYSQYVSHRLITLTLPRPDRCGDLVLGQTRHQGQLIGSRITQCTGDGPPPTGFGRLQQLDFIMIGVEFHLRHCDILVARWGGGYGTSSWIIQ